MSRPLDAFIDEWGNFVAIPQIVIKRMVAIESDAFALFCYLRLKTNEESHTAWPAYKRIMDETGLSRNKLAAAIHRLETNGLLNRTKRFGASTVYRLVRPPDMAGSSPEAGQLDETKASTVVPGQDDSCPKAGRQLSRSGTPVPHHWDATLDSITPDSEEVVVVEGTTTSEILSRVCALGVDVLNAQRLVLETPVETLEQYLEWAAIGQRCNQLTSPAGWFIAAVRGRWIAPRWITQRVAPTEGRRYVEGELKDFIEH